MEHNERNTIEEELKRTETITAILQMMDSSEPLENVLKKVFMVSGMYLAAKNIYIYSRNGKNVTYTTSYKEEEENVKVTQWLKKIMKECDKDFFIVTPDSEQGFLERKTVSELGLPTVMLFPIVFDDEIKMYAVLVDDDPSKIWNASKIVFMADAIKIVQNIVYKRNTKEALESSYKALSEILDNINNGIYVVDTDSKEILFCNDSMKRIVKKDMVGHKCCDFHLAETTYDCDKCKAVNSLSYYRELYDNERDIWLDVKNNQIKWVDGRKVSLCNITDITEKKKYEKKIEFQANNDFLTGLYNRMRCENDIAACVEDAVNSKRSGMLLFIDLDDFKHINDGLGHQYGDMLLRMISMGLQQINGIEEHCYRMGGDEFVIIIEPDKFEMFESILNSIQDLFNNPWYLSGNEYYCKMSMGIVQFPEDGDDVNDLIKKADIAMYGAKKNGKNHYEYYNASDEKTMLKRLDIEKNMRDAISLGCNEFEIFIQPIVDANTQECVGGESLIRWNSLNLGFLSPCDFIPLAEHLGLISPIGDYFFRKVCEVSKAWSDRGINKKLNVNLSVVQLMRNNIVKTIKEIIEETGVDPKNIVLEITENLAINDMVRVKKIMEEIKALGVKIALDDFGTGYSSLNYIKQLNLDIIKVDRSFIQDIVSDDYAKTVVKLIAELSETLHMSVCVEGVECREQYNMLKDMHIDFIQGYYFGKPIPLKEFEEHYLGLKID